ncbi:MAG: Gfo/Idh/MocA family oxidoreductase [Gemmataceae bacterium]
MSDKILRFGILGVARINERLLPGFRLAQHADLLAIASRSADRAWKAASEAGIPRAYGSYEELLADPDIGAVYIPLPNTLHFEWARRAADAGKHILCEKPLTQTATLARELVDYCAARGVTLMDGFMWPHHPRTTQIREMLDRGVIGPVQRVSAAFTFKLPLEPGNIRLKPDMAGGSLLDVGCYPIYGIRWAFGAEPVAVYARARYEYDVDLDMSGMLWFADGRVATFDCGFTQPMRQWLEITGTEGVLQVHDMWLPNPEAIFTVERDGEEPELFSAPGHHQIACMIDNFSQAVLHRMEVRPSPEQAVATLRVLDALAKSAAEGREIDV